MREINPRPGACVCVGRWDGQIVFDKPHAYDAYKQGDTPMWRRMMQARERMRDNAEDKTADGEPEDGGAMA